MIAAFHDEFVRIPQGINSLEAFREWAHSDDFPEKVPITYHRGEIWVDPYMEQLYTHNRVKTQITIVLGGMIETAGLGQYFSDGIRLSNAAAELSTNPDGVFVSFEAIRAGKVRRKKGRGEGATEIVGTPDMVLEVVSPWLEGKDTVDFVATYWQAGIPEYWLVDVRGPRIRFDIHRHGARGYRTTRRQAGGWVRSDVFEHSFRLTKTTDPVGDPQFKLALRS